MSTDERGRTKVEVSNDIAYEVRLHERHVRLYRRTRALLAFVALCGGATAFSNLFSEIAWLRGVGGAMVAACAFFDTVFDYANKAAVHDMMRREYLQLQAREGSLSTSELDAELSRLAVNSPGSIESLRLPSHNDMLRTRGYDDRVAALNFREHVANFLA